MNYRLILFFVIIFVWALTACDFMQRSDVLAIEVDEETIMQAYEIGDFDLEKIRLTIYYEDGTTQFVALNESMLDPGEIDLFSIRGTHTVNITYQDFRTTLTVMIVEKVVITYTIMFELNGGTADEVIGYKASGSIDIPANLIKEGHTFKGWYADELLTVLYDFSTRLSENITVYAKWEVNDYTVCFDTTGGTYIACVDVTYNTLISQPENPTKVGHTFTGWFTDETLTEPFIFSFMPSRNITVYAGWDENE